MTEIKESTKNLLIYGLGLGVVLFFVYLIIKEQNKTLLAAIKPVAQTSQTYQPVVQQTDNLLMQQLMIQTQELQNQTKQINDTLTFQTQELQLLHELQLNQQQNINQIESTKCSNVVSMNSGTYPSLNNSINNLNKIYPTNVRRETEEKIANNMFGMK